MDEPKMITVPQSEWQGLQAELKRLREENVYLRIQAHQGPYSPIFNTKKNRINISNNSKGLDSPIKIPENLPEEKQGFITEMKKWADSFHSKVDLKKNVSEGEKSRPEFFPSIHHRNSSLAFSMMGRNIHEDDNEDSDSSKNERGEHEIEILKEEDSNQCVEIDIKSQKDDEEVQEVKEVEGQDEQKENINLSGDKIKDLNNDDDDDKQSFGEEINFSNKLELFKEFTCRKEEEKPDYVEEDEEKIKQQASQLPSILTGQEQDGIIRESMFGKNMVENKLFGGTMRKSIEMNKEDLKDMVESQRTKDFYMKKVAAAFESILGKNKKNEESKLLQCICLYGPRWDEVKQKNEKKSYVKPELAYISDPSLKSQFSLFGEYFYTEGDVTCRKIRDAEMITQINQMVFRKNTKKQDCTVFLFQSDQLNESIRVENQLMNQINPAKWHVAFCVEFIDFDFIQIQQPIEDENNDLNKSTEMQKNSLETEQKKSERINLATSKKMKRKVCVKSKYKLCIFTYFPFLNIMEQLLISILDEVKIRRVEKYATESEKETVTIKYFIKELQKIGEQVITQIQGIPPKISDDKYSITLGNFKINFSLSRNTFEELVYGGWAFDVLKLFDKDLLFDIFTNILMEESICFVGQNLNILTHVIFLFILMMPHPFSYPYPCISKLFNFEILDSPFVVTMGINESSKWLEENVAYYDKKIFIDLNDDVKIKGKKKPKTIKSQKLKKVFSHLFKKIEPSSPLPKFIQKKGNIIKPASKEENDCCFLFFRNLRNFFREEIIYHMPNPAIISHIRENIKEENEVCKVTLLLKQVEKYLKQSRKQRQKDQFIDMFVEQQVFFIYASQKYGLN